jgi:hypothetical protein
LNFRGGFATDYIYRGTTLLDHTPAVGAAIEAAFAQLYAGVGVASVKLPTQPSTEITMSGGIGQTIGNVDFDLGTTYFLYPGEIVAAGSNGIDYWEAAIRADKTDLRLYPHCWRIRIFTKRLEHGYAAAGLGFIVPSNLLPPDVGMSISGAAGYSWFGNQSPDLGGFPLRAYLNWQAGVTFTRKLFNLDLPISTPTSKENCFVLTGDPNARPGASILSPIPRASLQLVQRDFCRKTLVCVEIA